MKRRFVLACASLLALAPNVAVAAESPELARGDAAVVAARYDERVRARPGFGGIRLAPDGAIEVSFTTEEATFRQESVATGHGASFRFVNVRYTMSELIATRDRIRARANDLAASGIDLVSWGPDVTTNSVRVGVAGGDAEDEAALRAAFGPTIRVERSSRPRRIASRLNDVSPWNGGDFIAMDNGGDCTSGPPVYKPSTGQTYLLTAGHCFLDNTTTGLTGFGFRAFQGSHFIDSGTSPFMGYAAAELVANGYDAALIATSSSRLAWRTQTANQTTGSAPQYAVQGSVVGATVCASGAPSGERCGATVKFVNQDTRTFDGVVTINMVAAENPGVALVGDGDSGGPVYQVHNGQLLMTGTIIALGDDSQNPSPDFLLCPQNDQTGRGVGCTDVVWYHDLPSVLNHLGVALKTS